MITLNQLPGFLAIVLLGGCMNLSGISGSSDSFGCKAPEGVICTSVSGVYANAVRNNLPGQKTGQEAAAPAVQMPDMPRVAPRVTLSSGEAIRSQPRVMRIWVAPWEDADGDLHDQSFIFVTVDSGRWLIEHNRARIRQGYAPAMPLRQPVAADKIDTQPVSQQEGGSHAE
ncbi:MAG: TraV family lipoprotein [Gammaproteobacteria bacterium]|nr:TraV family lipoprotein [Gammaproteobacteria bacterium]